MLTTRSEDDKRFLVKQIIRDATRAIEIFPKERSFHIAAGNAIKTRLESYLSTADSVKEELANCKKAYERFYGEAASPTAAWYEISAGSDDTKLVYFNTYITGTRVISLEFCNLISTIQTTGLRMLQTLNMQEKIELSTNIIANTTRAINIFNNETMDKEDKSQRINSTALRAHLNGYITAAQEVEKYTQRLLDKQGKVKPSVTMEITVAPPMARITGDSGNTTKSDMAAAPTMAIRPTPAATPLIDVFDTLDVFTQEDGVDTSKMYEIRYTPYSTNPNRISESTYFNIDIPGVRIVTNDVISEINTIREDGKKLMQAIANKETNNIKELAKKIRATVNIAKISFLGGSNDPKIIAANTAINKRLEQYQTIAHAYAPPLFGSAPRHTNPAVTASTTVATETTDAPLGHTNPAVPANAPVATETTDAASAAHMDPAVTPPPSDDIFAPELQFSTTYHNFLDNPVPLPNYVPATESALDKFIHTFTTEYKTYCMLEHNLPNHTPDDEYLRKERAKKLYRQIRHMLQIIKDNVLVDDPLLTICTLPPVPPGNRQAYSSIIKLELSRRFKEVDIIAFDSPAGSIPAIHVLPNAIPAHVARPPMWFTIVARVKGGHAENTIRGEINRYFHNRANLSQLKRDAQAGKIKVNRNNPMRAGQGAAGVPGENRNIYATSNNNNGNPAVTIEAAWGKVNTYFIGLNKDGIHRPSDFIGLYHTPDHKFTAEQQYPMFSTTPPPPIADESREDRAIRARIAAVINSTNCVWAYGTILNKLTRITEFNKLPSTQDSLKEIIKAANKDDGVKVAAEFLLQEFDLVRNTANVDNIIEDIKNMSIVDWDLVSDIRDDRNKLVIPVQQAGLLPENIPVAAVVPAAAVAAPSTTLLPTAKSIPLPQPAVQPTISTTLLQPAAASAFPTGLKRSTISTTLLQPAVQPTKKTTLPQPAAAPAFPTGLKRSADPTCSECDKPHIAYCRLCTPERYMCQHHLLEHIKSKLTKTHTVVSTVTKKKQNANTPLTEQNVNASIYDDDDTPLPDVFKNDTDKGKAVTASASSNIPLSPRVRVIPPPPDITPMNLGTDDDVTILPPPSINSSAPMDTDVGIRRDSRVPVPDNNARVIFDAGFIPSSGDEEEHEKDYYMSPDKE